MKNKMKFTIHEMVTVMQSRKDKKELKEKPIISFRHSSKNYGLVMTGQAAAAPVIAIITEFLSPAIGWFGMFIIIAGASILCCAITLKYPRHPSPKAIIERLQRPPPEQL